MDTIEALHAAAAEGHESVVDRILAIENMDVNVVTKDGDTPLHLAAKNGKENVVQILLKAQHINPNKKNKDGESALFSAARADTKSALKDIYAAIKNLGSEEDKAKIRADVLNNKNHEGKTILHLAADNGWVNVIDFLFAEFKADAGCVDVNMKTHLSLSSSDNAYGCLEKEASVIALDIALEKNDFVVVERLTFFRTVTFTVEDKNGHTRLEEIFANPHKQEIFKLLRRTPEVQDYIDALYKDRQASVDAANAILVGAAIIASVTFAAWLQPPLGYTTYYQEQYMDSLPAPPVSFPQYVAFDHHPILRMFWVFNSLSFFCATTTVISGARSVLPARKIFIKQEVKQLRGNLWITSILLGFSMLFVLLAFAMAGIVVLPPMMRYRANIFATITVGGILSLSLLFLLGKNIIELFNDINSSKNHQGKETACFPRFATRFIGAFRRGSKRELEICLNDEQA